MDGWIRQQAKNNLDTPVEASTVSIIESESTVTVLSALSQFELHHIIYSCMQKAGSQNRGFYYGETVKRAKRSLTN